MGIAAAHGAGMSDADPVSGFLVHSRLFHPSVQDAVDGLVECPEVYPCMPGIGTVHGVVPVAAGGRDRDGRERQG
jgi:hypothetical protein